MRPLARKELLTPMTGYSTHHNGGSSSSSSTFLFQSPIVEMLVGHGGPGGSQHHPQHHPLPGHPGPPGHPSDDYYHNSTISNMTPEMLRFGQNNSLTLGTLNASHIEEFYEAKLHPEDCLFEEVLRRFLYVDEESKVVSGQRAIDRGVQEDIAKSYAWLMNARRVAASEDERKLVEESAMLGQPVPATSVADPQTALKSSTNDALAFRAERDLWMLLEKLTHHELLGDVDNATEERRLWERLDTIDHSAASIRDVLDAAFDSDKRLRKGRVLVDWLEECAVDKIREVQETPSEAPWGQTLSALMSSRNPNTNGRVSSLHPDAQLQFFGGPSGSGRLLALEGDDGYDQEKLLQYVWQLVRGGRLSQALEVAMNHRLFWLAGSLSGVQDLYYEEQPSSLSFGGELEGEVQPVQVVQRGNSRKAHWLRTCWKYADSLSKDPANFSGRKESTVASLEMTIYAALANHTQLLLKQPSVASSGLSPALVSTWSDKLWVVLKSVHDRDLLTVLHLHHQKRRAHSDFYRGCDDSALQTEEELLQKLDNELGDISMANWKDIFTQRLKLNSPPKTVEEWILKLQSSIIRGKTALHDHIQDEVIPLLKRLQRDSFRKGNALVKLLRVYCHFFVWLKYTAVGSGDLSDVVSIDDLQLAVKCYVDHLVENKQRTLVAPYLCFVDRAVRVSTYADVLLSLAVSGPISQDEAAPLVRLGQSFFPRDFPSVLQTICEVARLPKEDVCLSQGVVNKSALFIAIGAAAAAVSGDGPSIMGIADTPATVTSGMANNRSVRFAATVAGTPSTPFARPANRKATPFAGAAVAGSGGNIVSARTPYHAPESAHAISTPTSAGEYLWTKRFRRAGGMGTTPVHLPGSGVAFNSSAQKTPTASAAPSASFAYLHTDHFNLLAKKNWGKEFQSFSDSFALIGNAATVDSSLRLLAAATDNGGPDQVKGSAEWLRMTQMIGAEDTARLNCLVWKWSSVAIRPTLDDTQPAAWVIPGAISGGPQLDAVRQCNRVLNALYLESMGKKLLQAKFVLHKYCPPLSECADRVNRELAITLQEHNQPGIASNLESTWLSEIATQTEIAVLEFWNRYMEAMEALGRFKHQLKEFHATRSGLFGDANIIRSSMAHVSKELERKAADTLGKLIACIESVGITQVWKGLQRFSIRQTVNTLRQAITHFAADTSRSTSSSSTASQTQSAVFQHNIDDIQAVVAALESDPQSNNFFAVTGDAFDFDVRTPQSDDDLLASQSASGFAAVVKKYLGQLVSLLDDAKPQGVHHEQATQLALDAVSTSKALLLDIQAANHLAARLSHQLLKMHLEVCSDVANALENIYGANCREADPWNHRAVMLANVIASSDPSLQLFKILTRRDLESLLQSITDASMRSLSSATGEGFLLRGEKPKA